MSNKNNNTTTAAAVSQNAAAVIETGEKTDTTENQGYYFPDYDDQGQPVTSTDLGPILKPDALIDDLHFAWALTAKYHRWEKRYFRKVSKELDGDKFLPQAFRKLDGFIGVGSEKDGQPELTLCVRDKAADVAETRALLRAVGSKMAPASQARAGEITSSIDRALHDSQGEMTLQNIAPSLWGSFGQ